VSILEECAALRAVAVREALVAEGSGGSMETVATAILAELQEEQDREVAATLTQIEAMVGTIQGLNKVLTIFLLNFSLFKLFHIA